MIFKVFYGILVLNYTFLKSMKMFAILIIASFADIADSETEIKEFIWFYQAGGI